MSFPKLSSYSKPDQPSNALALDQEKQSMRERNQLPTRPSLYFKTEQTRKVYNWEMNEWNTWTCSRHDRLVSSEKSGSKGSLFHAPLLVSVLALWVNVLRLTEYSAAASQACHSSFVRAQIPINSYLQWVRCSFCCYPQADIAHFSAHGGKKAVAAPALFVEKATCSRMEHKGPKNSYASP